MTKKLDLIIVVDVESTCWEGESPKGQEREIIEIGICPLEIATGKRHPKRCIFVKPEKSTISDYCTKLTTLTQDQINTGISLKDACSILEKEFLTKERTWASWGDYDREKFKRECESKNIKYPFGPRHINIKNLFAIEIKLAKEVDLEVAMNMLKLPFEGVIHRAVDDAFNMALVLSKVISKKE
ncbi:MAG TPA: 3'-5' exonuclease [Candidatus Deferrimicrobium sp.]|nr:3'-5' exonuclease [Candidatus Deferrimicrobium sp.]